MATSDYNSSIDLRLPLYPDTKPSYDFSVFTDINALFTAVRLLAEGVQEQLATKVDEAPEDGQSYVRQDGEWVVITGGGGGDAGAFTNDDVAPASPVLGHRWYAPTSAILYTRINDGVSDQWVELY